MRVSCASHDRAAGWAECWRITPRVTSDEQPKTDVCLTGCGVAVVVGVIFFAFLRPTELGELSEIEAPGGDGPTFVLPGDAEKRKSPGTGQRRRTQADRRDPPDRATSRPFQGPTRVVAVAAADDADR